MEKLAVPINEKKITAFCRKHHVSTLALFGSILTSRFKPSSDVDVLISFEEKHSPNFFEFIDMESELGTLFGRDVDLKTPGDLSPYFRDEVQLSALQLYG